MYMCLDCDRVFEAALAKQVMGSAPIWVCPYCLSEEINSFVTMREKLDAALQKLGLLNETCGSCDDCEFTDCVNNNLHVPNHPNCKCIPENEQVKNGGFFFPEMAGNDENGYAGLPVQNKEISFEDLQLNEFVLLAMDALREFEPVFEKGETYITDMNSRFLHTFIDACFVP